MKQKKIWISFNNIFYSLDAKSNAQLDKNAYKRRKQERIVEKRQKEVSCPTVLSVKN